MTLLNVLQRNASIVTEMPDALTDIAFVKTNMSATDWNAGVRFRK